MGEEITSCVSVIIKGWKDHDQCHHDYSQFPYWLLIMPCLGENQLKGEILVRNLGPCESRGFNQVK